MQIKYRKIIMSETFTIIYERKGCIGAGVCAAIADKHWVMNEDGKADLVDSKNDAEGNWVREITQEEFDVNMQSAEGCPANVIHIIKKSTGEKLI